MAGMRSSAAVALRACRCGEFHYIGVSTEYIVIECERRLAPTLLGTAVGIGAASQRFVWNTSASPFIPAAAPWPPWSTVAARQSDGYRRRRDGFEAAWTALHNPFAPLAGQCIEILENDEVEVEPPCAAETAPARITPSLRRLSDNELLERAIKLAGAEAASAAPLAAMYRAVGAGKSYVVLGGAAQVARLSTSLRNGCLLYTSDAADE